MKKLTKLVSAIALLCAMALVGCADLNNTNSPKNEFSGRTFANEEMKFEFGNDNTVTVSMKEKDSTKFTPMNLSSYVIKGDEVTLKALKLPLGENYKLLTYEEYYNLAFTQMKGTMSENDAKVAAKETADFAWEQYEGLTPTNCKYTLKDGVLTLTYKNDTPLVLKEVK